MLRLKIILLLDLGMAHSHPQNRLPHPPWRFQNERQADLLE